MIAALVGLAAAVTLAVAPTSPARVLMRLQDPRIDEASGIAVGRVSPGIVYVQNDSGDSARFFAVDARTGATAATVTVPGATNVDWEDIAAAPDAAGTPSVWLADIGDNDAQRREVDVYRVDEPRIATTDRGRSVRTARPDVWRLRYATGPTDAESLAVTPGGVVYVVTKSLFGTSSVYRLPARPDAGAVRTLSPVGSITFRPTGTANPFGAIGSVTATGASISADGSVVAVRTYSDAYLWRMSDGDVAAALRRAPTRIALPAEPQGEGIAVDGDRLLVDSEHAGTAVWSVPIPTAVRTPSATATPTPASSAPASSATPHAAAPTADGTRTGDDAGLLVAVIAGALLVVVGAGGAVRHHIRRNR